MIDWADVTPIIVTRGDVDLLPIIQTLPFSHVVIWNNGDGSRHDRKVYGRYAAIEETPSPYIFVCDDDVILGPHSYDELLAAHEPGQVTANMPARFRHDFYSDHCLVGFGAIFDRNLPSEAFDAYFAWDAREHKRPWVEGSTYLPNLGISVGLDVDEYAQWFFYRCCDIVFTALTPRVLLDLPYTEREFASAPNRMWKQPDHVGERAQMLERVRKVRDAA